MHTGAQVLLFLFCSRCTPCCPCPLRPQPAAPARQPIPRSLMRARTPRAWGLTVGRGAAPSRTHPAATRRKRALPSTTAGRADRGTAAVQDRASRIDAARKVITRNTSPDISVRPLDQSLSRLRARLRLLLRAADPRLSRALPRARFPDRSLHMKPDAAGFLRARAFGPALQAADDRASAPTPIPTSRSSDATRSCSRILEVFEHAGHPVGIVTKSNLIMRDIDIFRRMAARNLGRSRSR